MPGHDQGPNEFIEIMKHIGTTLGLQTYILFKHASDPKLVFKFIIKNSKCHHKMQLRAREG
jgi:hypothetical protein